jgi:hypothetical protein
MKNNKFWKIIENTNQQSLGDRDKYCKILKEKLEALSINEVIEFHDYLCSYQSLAYRTDLWEAATIINGCCTDDGFDYFRSWLISAGRSVYEYALCNPESLVDVVEVGTRYEFECIDYIAADVYKQKTGKQIPYGGSKVVGKYDNDKNPNNGGLGNDNGLILQVNYPKLWEKFRGETEMSWESANILLALDKYVEKHEGRAFYLIGYGAANENYETIDSHKETFGGSKLIIATIEEMLNGLNNSKN